MKINTCNTTEPIFVYIGGNTVERTGHFKYLGTLLHESGDIDIKAHIPAGWAK